MFSGLRGLRGTRTVLNSAGIEVLSGGRRANGADRALLLRAKALHLSGVQRFVVASNDGVFARLANLGNLDVVTLQGAPLSRRLRAAARTVRVLRRHGDRWCLSVEDPGQQGDDAALCMEQEQGG